LKEREKMNANVHRISAGIIGALLIASVRLVVAAGPSQPQDYLFSRTLTVGPSAALDLSNVSGDIEIRGGAGDQIEIQARKSGDPSLADIEVSQTGDRVLVETRYKRGRSKGPSVEYEVTVPTRTAVSAKSVSGDVGVHDVAGYVRAESVSGGITVTNAGNLLLAKSVSGEVTIQSATSQKEPEIASVSGEVSVSQLRAEGVTVSNVSGGVIFTDTDCGSAVVESVSGGIRYGGNLARGGRYEFESHSGNVRLQIANEVGFELEAETFSGTIKSDFPITGRTDRRRENEVHGVFGDGSALIRASTFSGNISINKD
jgi:DUF4097 and DUF4098 domain-containing protein YvlB